MPSDRRERSASAGSNRSGHSRASSSMGLDGGEAGRRMAQEEEYIRRELQEATSFCNAFWGSNDAGYDVIQGRMKGASRTMDDIRAMYKERADIEAEYAKRLAKLGKLPIGKEETGSTRAALEVIRMELDTTSRTHADLAGLIKKDLEGGLVDFASKIASARKNSTAQIEKLYKQKQAQEAYVAKSRDKYEQDCIRINGYTAQSSLVQGRDLDKVTNKLDKAQATVAANEKDYQNFVKALKDTTYRWNGEWKAYLDQCQDIEEERLDFIKGNLWTYANSISAVCVADDESCERIRVALENCEAPRDVLDFIQRYGTGPAIPEPPEYINYARGQPPPARPSFRTANFQRNTTRPPSHAQASVAPAQSQPSAGGVTPDPRSRKSSAASQGPPPGHPQAQQLPPQQPQPPQQQQQRAPESAAPSAGFRPPPGAVGLPGMVPSSQQVAPPEPLRDSEAILRSVATPAAANSMSSLDTVPKDQRRMSAKNFLARTPSFKRPPEDGPGRSGSAQAAGGPPAANGSSNTLKAEDEDPIAKALAQLRMRGGRSPGPASAGPTSPKKGPSPDPRGSIGPSHGGLGAYQQQHQQQQGPNRAPSPAPSANGSYRARSPSAAFMQAPERAPSPLPVEEVLDTYGQSFPGERRSLSRQNSSASRRSSVMPGDIVGGPQRAKSPGPQGFAGVGAIGRSPSPGPQAQQRQQQQQQHQSRSSQQNMAPPGRNNPPPRSASPLGISLDATGSVTHDQMAEEFVQRSGSVQGQRPDSQRFGQPPQQQQQQPPPQQRPTSVVHAHHQSQQRPAYQQAPVAHQQQQSGYGYPQQGSAANGQPPAGYGQPVQGYSQYAPSPSHVPQQASAYDSMASLGRAQGGAYAAAGYQQQQQQQPSAAAPSAGYAPAPSASQSLHGQHYAQPSYASTYAGATPVGAPPQQQPGMYAPAGAAAAPPPQESAATAYAQQYRAQHGYGGAPAAATGAPAWAQQQGAAPVAAAPQQYGHPSAAASSAAAARAPSPAVPAAAPHGGGGAAPPPTGQYSDSGKPILFYVKASYDYTATLDEEFSFTKGDIIAVWETNPDGWWQGELLDDARRRPGANTFPSNFVTLLA